MSKTENTRSASVKRPGALRTIGEVSEALGLRTHVLRYWETQFPMLQPVKRSGSRRYYRPEDIALLGEIDQLVHREGYTLRGARLHLEQRAKVSVASVATVVRSDDSGLAGESIHDSLKKLRDRLRISLAGD